MKVEEIMSKNPVCCTPETSIAELAQIFVEFDCGAVPVVDDPEQARPVIGIVTDRDIVCRLLAKGLNPLEMAVKDCMTAPVLGVRPDDSIDECRAIMEQYQIRRVPVINKDGECVGMVTQAHIALNSTASQTGEYLKGVSARGEGPSRVTNVR